MVEVALNLYNKHFCSPQHHKIKYFSDKKLQMHWHNFQALKAMNHLTNYHILSIFLRRREKKLDDSSTGQQISNRKIKDVYRFAS